MNGSTFLYSVAGAGPVAVQVTPIGTEDYSVHAWMPSPGVASATAARS